MSAARRSLPTAVAAGALLVGLWFVPTAHASADFIRPAASERHSAAGHGADAATASAGSARTVTDAAARTPEADWAAGTAPYLIGSSVVLGLGAGAAYGLRRRRTSTR